MMYVELTQAEMNINFDIRSDNTIHNESFRLSVLRDP